VLPNHTYRYYLTFALPAALLALFASLHVIWPKLPLVAAAVLVIASAIGFRMREREGVDLDGANATLERASLVADLEPFLTAAAPLIPQGATLLFQDINVWAFGKERGPRLWCGNPTLRAFDKKHLVGTTIVDSPAHQGELFTGAKNSTSIDPATTFIVRREGEGFTLDTVGGRRVR
jgi:hypothetical protein